MLSSELWSDCTSFHGHACPGIALGFKAVEAAADLFCLEVRPGMAVDGLTCVSTTAKCPVDAVRCLLGCTEKLGTLEVRPADAIAFEFTLATVDGAPKTVCLALKPGATDGRSREEAQAHILAAPYAELYEVTVA